MKKILIGIITASAFFALPAFGATDSFGITQLNPTSGRIWVSNWANGAPRTIQSGDRDPYDSYNLFVARGDGKTTINGSGIATLTGSAPRMYLYNAAKEKIWGDVEITFYAKRISEAQTLSYQGFTAAAKTDHTNDTTDICGTRGYFGRMLYDGRMDFEKEINHHADDGYVQFGSVKPWTSLPKNQWIGYKFIARDDGSSVKFELYRDLTGGTNGGDWKLMTSATDSGQYGAGHTPCAAGINPAQVLTGSNVSVYVRNDGLGQAQYKWFSVREIGAVSTPPTATSTPVNPNRGQMLLIIDGIISSLQGIINLLAQLKTLI